MCVWTLVTDKTIAIAPSDDAGLMYRCSGIKDSYCCSEDSKPCSCEISNVTLAPLYKGVSSIGSIAAEALETQAVSSSTMSGRCLRNCYFKCC